MARESLGVHACRLLKAARLKHLCGPYQSHLAHLFNSPNFSPRFKPAFAHFWQVVAQHLAAKSAKTWAGAQFRIPYSLNGIDGSLSYGELWEKADADLQPQVDDVRRQVERLTSEEGNE